jgi:tetratricopeptide (TPR) repeat protein
VLNYPRNLDQNYINYLIIGNKHMSLLNKIKELKNNYAFLFLLVVFPMWAMWNVSRPQTSSAADTALSNAMVYFEKGDFDNAVLQLESVVEDHKKTSAAVHAKFYLGRTAFINGNNDKAMMLLSECASKLDYSILKTEAYIMLGQLDSDIDNALRFFDKAAKNALSDNEVTYISILKAKRLTMVGKKSEALEILDNLDSENNAYKELFEEVYGVALTLN